MSSRVEATLITVLVGLGNTRMLLIADSPSPTQASTTIEVVAVLEQPFASV
jgi:hypothetical protein